MVRKTYTKKARRPRAKKHAVTQKKTTWSKQLKSLIKKTVAQKVEVKTVSNGLMDNESIGVVQYSASPPGQVMTLNGGDLSSIFGTISQGSTAGSRIGNEITVKRMTLNGVINFNWDLLSQVNNNLPKLINQPYYVTLYIFKRRDATVPTFSVQLPDFFQVGSNSVPPSITALDSTLYINKDVYQILHKKRFKLGAQSYDISGFNYTNITAGPTPQQFNYVSNNDFKSMIPFKISLSKYFANTKVRYNDASSTPQNAKVRVMYMFLVHGANAQYIWNSAVSDALPIGVTMSQNLQYTDS